MTNFTSTIITTATTIMESIEARLPPSGVAAITAALNRQAQEPVNTAAACFMKNLLADPFVVRIMGSRPDERVVSQIAWPWGERQQWPLSAPGPALAL
ncbi:hypothetical protein AAG895_08835 [Thauera sp. JM12B12]|uniref:hypothetical protein n=1 Tax=Thauera sp. JM12B12 TaxID=3142262 RepID=UPI0031F40370